MRSLRVHVHVLEQKLAVPFYSVERRAQVMTQTAMEGFEQFVFLTIGRQLLDEPFHECVELDTRAAHPVEIGEDALGLRGARVLDDHVEQIGDGSGGRLHLLSEECRQGPAQALV